MHRDNVICFVHLLSNLCCNEFHTRCRFGTVAAAVVNGSEGTKKAEELKRKARADRYVTMLSLCLIVVYCLVFIG